MINYTGTILTIKDHIFDEMNNTYEDSVACLEVLDETGVAPEGPFCLVFLD